MPTPSAASYRMIAPETPPLAAALQTTTRVRPAVQLPFLAECSVMSVTHSLSSSVQQNCRSTDQRLWAGGGPTCAAGHAPRGTDNRRAFGALVGKALTSLDSGQGMVRVLVNIS